MSNTKSIDPEVLRELVDAKIIGQRPWKELPEVYERLTGDTADWRTLYRYVNEEVGAATLPTRVSKRCSEQVTQAFEDANAITLAIHVLVGTYREWNILFGRHLRSLAVTEEDRQDEEVTVTPPLTPAEVTRMDQLRKDIVSFLFSGLSMFRQAQQSTDLLQRAFGAGAIAATAGVVTGASIGTGALTEEVGTRTLQMLEEMNERHKQEAIGHYRPRVADQHELADEEDEDG